MILATQPKACCASAGEGRASTFSTLNAHNLVAKRSRRRKVVVFSPSTIYGFVWGYNTN